MKTVNILKCIALSLLIGVSLASCKEDELEAAPRLFRPVVTLDNQNNNVIATWDNIKGATSYELEFYQGTGKQTEDGMDILKKILTVTTDKSPYTFEDVEWDVKYAVRIKAIGTSIESEFYDSKSISVVYPTKLSGSKTIDLAALINWSTGGNIITKLAITLQDTPSAAPIIVNVTESDYNAGKKAIQGLTPKTAYKLVAYSGAEGDKYEGRLLFTTREAENFEAKYGAGKYIDIRNSEDAKILTSTEFLEQINAVEGINVILQGNFKYSVGSAIKFKKSVNFVTGLSLEGNAIIVQAAAFQTDANATIDKLSFEEVDIISDKADDTPIASTTDKTFGGRQVYNVNGSNSLVKELRFTNCRLEGYRALVRLQAASDGVTKVVFNGCTINGVGDQGVVTTNNTAAQLNEIEFNNSTLTNIVMLADIRNSKSKPALTISNCTFCYAPIEITANANTPMCRFEKNAVDMTVENTIFGPSMATPNAAAATVQTNTAGSKGSIFLNASATSASVTNSFKTNFDWTVIGLLSYPLEGLSSIAMDEKALFSDPGTGVFTIKGSFDGASTAGAVKWRK